MFIEMSICFFKENRSANANSNIDTEANGIETATEEIAYPDLLDGNQSTQIESSHNE